MTVVLTKPIKHDGLEFGAGWTGSPGEANAADAIAQHVAQNGWEGIAGRKVGMESRVLPVCDPGHDLLLHIGHDLVPVLGVLGSLR